MKEETPREKIVRHTLATAMMAAGTGLLGYSVYEVVEDERQQRERFQQIEQRKSSKE